MRSVCLTDLSVVSALGDSLDETWSRLCAGESAMAPVTRFDTSRLGARLAACRKDLDGNSANRVCSLMTKALKALPPLPPNTAVIWAGVKGSVDYIEGRAHETIYLAEHYRRWVCERLGLDGRGLEVNAACASSTVGLALGAHMIASGACSSVLVCAADIVSRFTFTGFAALKGLTPTACRPFDIERDGLALGDGAAAILLTSAQAARAHGRQDDIRLTGWGIANDANHITGPARDGIGLILSIRSALDQARLAPDDIEAFCAHGTGTIYNDAMELTALDAVFGPRPFPAFSIKGALGHTLGAAGAIEAALCVRALRERRVPPTAGLRRAEPRAFGRVTASTQWFPGRRILTTNSGFGGINAALVLERRLRATEGTRP